MGGGINISGIEFIQLLYIGEYVVQLSRHRFQLCSVKVELRQPGYMLHVFFTDFHGLLLFVISVYDMVKNFFQHRFFTGCSYFPLQFHVKGSSDTCLSMYCTFNRNKANYIPGEVIDDFRVELGAAADVQLFHGFFHRHILPVISL
ncbi:hypothetical protein SAMN05660330_03950 [Desulforhopalus singaporensis]|uniref:Uncharacterized protein n=1 Tax=Desulforhopalus singaporensis TaxID=91360 RepID=A0A1H0V9X1_9BACT|nr:hypothetical protein SAMN05660330_03950 [Desulforhopalus singaporensis]